MLINLEPKLKKKKPAGYFDLDDDIDQEWILEHQQYLAQELRDKIEKKFAKDNEKLVADKEKPMKESELKERLKAVKELESKYKKENSSKKVLAEGKSPSVERFEGNIKKLTDRVKNMELQAEDKESNKEVALGTSKTNYIDPRLSVVFCKKFDVPIEKIFPKTLRDKFAWAIDSVDENWTF
jgi:DNA topoisomerase-1